MKGVTIIQNWGGHEDSRREILEVYNGEFNAKQVKVLQIKEDSILGNHYHKFKQFFYILEGCGFYIFENIKTKERIHTLASPRTLIFIDKNIAHGAFLEEGTITIEGNSEKYKGKEDDIKYEVLK